MSINYYCL